MEETTKIFGFTDMEEYLRTGSEESWNASLVQNTTEFSNVASGNETSTSGIARFYPIIAAELALSSLCLIFSIVVYSILPEFRNVHGKNLISLSSCLLTSFVFFIFDVLLRNHVSKVFCLTFAAIIHITFLATFFWTNVMAFDIWRSLSDMKAKTEVKSQSRKYLKYSIYAWTATIMVGLPAALFEATDLVHEDFRPKFGGKRCWLNGITAFIYYFNFPVGVILFSNLVMYILTIRKLWLIKKMTKILPVKQQQQRLYLYLKLFLVMGITWMTEFIPWATGMHKLYAIAGMLTGLHGVLLFIIFVAKKRIFRQMGQKLGIGENTASSIKTSSSQPITSSSSNPKIIP